MNNMNDGWKKNQRYTQYSHAEYTTRMGVAIPLCHTLKNSNSYRGKKIMLPYGIIFNRICNAYFIFEDKNYRHIIGVYGKTCVR